MTVVVEIIVWALAAGRLVGSLAVHLAPDRLAARPPVVRVACGFAPLIGVFLAARLPRTAIR